MWSAVLSILPVIADIIDDSISSEDYTYPQLLHALPASDLC
jgi:hypothetical protein